MPAQQGNIFVGTDGMIILPHGAQPFALPEEIQGRPERRKSRHATTTPSSSTRSARAPERVHRRASIIQDL